MVSVTDRAPKNGEPPFDSSAILGSFVAGDARVAEAARIRGYASPAFAWVPLLAARQIKTLPVLVAGH